MIRVFPYLVVLSCVAGCAARTAPPVSVSRTVAVLPPYNLTGERLVVAGTGLIDRYLRHASRVTVADVLASEARFRLQEQGFEVADGRTIQASVKGRVPQSPEEAAQLAASIGLTRPVLFIEIRRWEPDAPTRADFVIVGLALALVEPSTGDVVWQAHRRAAPVATPGEATVEAAYVTAARSVIKEMLAPLQPEPAPAAR